MVFLAGGLAGVGLAWLFVWVNRAGDLYQETVLLGDEDDAGMVGRLRFSHVLRR